jgi:hypothetical protein
MSLIASALHKPHPAMTFAALALLAGTALFLRNEGHPTIRLFISAYVIPGH